ncbi:MAG: HAD-IC family P-type ATPase [Bacilli bacterium]|nr:HAD-IC family P-type ATPase [Bacilli bacterium]
MKKKIINKNITRFDPSPETGLSIQEVASRTEEGLLNINSNPTNKSYTRIILGNIFTGFNILMFAVAVILVLIVGPKVITNLMFLLIILFNILIGTIQECKSKHTIEKLKLLSDNKIKVRRGGQDIGISSTEIVLDDVLILSPGDQIPADCIILEEGVVEVNESLLTGESVPVKKNKGDQLFAGSFIVSGVAVCRADKIADDTYISSIENKAKLAKQPKSHLMLAIYKVIHVMTFIAIPLAVVVFVNEYIHGVINNGKGLPLFPSYWGEENVISDAVFYSGTTIAYMIPCGMALLASIAMATGVVKLGQSKKLAQNLYSVESLSRVNTLCLDKTGTLTDGTMSLDKYIILDKKFNDEQLQTLMASYLSAFKSTNQTSTALINRFGTLRAKEAPGQNMTSNALTGAFNAKSELKVADTIQFSSARKYSGVEFFKDGWYLLGAPDYLTTDKEILAQVDEYAKSGLRVVLLCKVDGLVTNKEKIPEKKHNVAMFVIRDTIRPEVKDTLLWFAENDVDIKVISGDNLGTVSYIAKESGIKNWDKGFDMSKLTPEDDLEEIVLNHWIFARVSPDQKADIIAVLKKNGRITGVTGDGLNDLLAFKQADCSIALANGAAATKNVANLILLDSNFANMKEAVFQGRRVVNNIQRSSSLFVMKDFLWFFITVMPILFGLPHMIQPTVMTIVNVFITGIASLFISLEPDKTRVTGNFYRNVVERAILSAFYMFIPVFLIMVYCIISQLATTQTFDASKLLTYFENGEVTQLGWIPIMALCVSIAGFVIFFESCRPFTKFRKILFGATLGIVLIVLYLGPDYFIISGTEMLAFTGGFLNIPRYAISHVPVNATFGLYRTMDLEQLLFLVGYIVLAYPLYLLNTKYVSKLADILLFNKREYLDE